MEAGWTFTPQRVKLTGDSGECAFRGIPVDAGGGKLVVEGKAIRLQVFPDIDTGRLSLTASCVFEIPDTGGQFVLKVPGFSPVQLEVAPKETDDDKKVEAT